MSCRITKDPHRPLMKGDNGAGLFADLYVTQVPTHPPRSRFSDKLHKMVCPAALQRDARKKSLSLKQGKEVVEDFVVRMKHLVIEVKYDILTHPRFLIYVLRGAVRNEVVEYVERSQPLPVSWLGKLPSSKPIRSSKKSTNENEDSVYSLQMYSPRHLPRQSSPPLHLSNFIRVCGPSEPVWYIRWQGISATWHVLKGSISDAENPGHARNTSAPASDDVNSYSKSGTQIRRGNVGGDERTDQGFSEWSVYWTFVVHISTVFDGPGTLCELLIVCLLHLRY